MRTSTGTVAAASPDKLDSVSFDQLLQRQHCLDTGTFDLTSTSFISPTGLVGLAVALEQGASALNETTLIVTDPMLRSYLSRAGLLDALPDDCVLVPDAGHLEHLYDHRLGQSPLLIELTRFDSESQLVQILDRTIVSVERVRGRRYDALDAAALVSELGANVLEHGGGRGYLALQVYTGSNGEPFLELAIGDGGPGIRQSLQANPSVPRLTDDLHAIQQSVRSMVSGSSEPARGSGLYQLLRVVILNHGGGVQIRTGAAKARWRAGRQGGIGFVVPDLGGTLISLTVPAP